MKSPRNAKAGGNALRGLLILLICVGLQVGCAWCASLSPKQILDDFAFFYSRYKEAYVFFDLKSQEYGVDWDEIYTKLRCDLAADPSLLNLYRAVTRMQCALHDGHAANMAVQEIMAKEGLKLQVVMCVPTEEGRLVVNYVKPGSNAYEAGIRPGDELVAFEGKTVRQLYKQARTLYNASSEGQFRHLVAMYACIHNPLLGPAPEKCKMRVRKPDGTEVDYELAWDVLPPSRQGTRAPVEIDVDGPLPIKAYILDPLKVAYVKIGSWMKNESPADQFAKLFEGIKDTEAMILDLRDNGGGVLPWGEMFCMYLVSDDPSGQGKTPLDTYMERLVSRTFIELVLSNANLSQDQIEGFFHSPRLMSLLFRQAFHIDISPEEMAAEHFENGTYKPFYITMKALKEFEPAMRYDGHVIVLTNGGTFSTSDLTVAILKEFKRIKIVGTPNGAGSGSPIPFVLPNSKLKIMVPHARGYPPFGTLVEGHPFTPDVVVAPDEEDIAAGRDPVLMKALEMVKPLASQSRGRVVLPVRVDEETARPVMDTTRPFDVRRILTPAWMRAALRSAGME